MSEKIKELKDKRAKIVTDQQAILDKAEAEKRGLTADENTNYENMDVEFNRLTDEIRTLEKEQDDLLAAGLKKKKLEERANLLKESVTDPIKPDPNPDGKDKRNQPEYADYRIDKRYMPIIEGLRRNEAFARLSTKEYLNAYRDYLIHGERNIASATRDILLRQQEEIRALQADSDTAGGYLVMPEQMVMRVIEALDNVVFVRQYATVIPLPTAASLGAPARENDIGDPTWTAEILTGAADSSLDFAKRELRPHPLARSIRVSNRLLRVSVIDIADYVAGRLAAKMGFVQENNFLNGNGVNQPLGVFTASDSGISTARDSSAGNTTSAMTGDGLIEAQMKLKKQYRTLPSCRWCFHRDGVKMIRKLKDGEGQYLWRMGMTEREPDRILGMPYEESEYAPSTFTTGKYVGILGDWSQYWIADSLAMEIQVVKELYAATNQTGYFGRLEADGQPVEENAFVRVQLG